MVYTGSLVMFLSPLTPLHAGVGRSGGVVDLPVQRDTLGFPIIYASSLKGAVKTHVYLRNREYSKKLFGPEPDDDGEKYASPLSLTDAYPLLVPARSAKANPVAVTSPFMIKKVLDLIELALATEVKDGKRLTQVKDLLEKLLKASGKIGEGEAVVLSEEAVMELGGKKRVIVAGEALDARVAGLDADYLANTAWDILRSALPRAFGDVLPGRLVILHNDTALRIVEKSMIRLTRVRLVRETKTVNGLWTEEYLPHGSLMVTVFLYSRYRGERVDLKEDSLEGLRKRVCEEALGIKSMCGYLVFGGKESVGKGITKVCIF